MYNLGLPVFPLCGMMLLRGPLPVFPCRRSLKYTGLRPEGDISE